MLQPQLKEKSMLETYQNVIGATYTIMDDVLQSARDVIKWVTWRRIVELGFRVQNDGARGRAYVVVENLQQLPNVVTGTFLLNDHYTCILFDSGAEKSFVSSAFTHFIDIAPATLNTSYEIELADGKVVSTNTILRSCTLVLLNYVFKIDMLPTRLGSFDVIIGMDWLAYHRALIDCYEKIVRIPLLNGKILEVQGERPEKDLRSLACIKADEKKLDDIRVVRDFPEVLRHKLGWEDRDVNDVKQIHATVDGKKVVISESSVRSDLYFNDEDDEACFTEWDDRVKLVQVTEPGARIHEGVHCSTRSEKASKHSYDLPLLGVNTTGSDEERFEQHELMDNIPPTPYDSPLLGEGLESDLKKTKKLYATAFKKLINRNLETQEGFGDGQEVSTAAQEVSTASPQRNADTTADELTLAETLMEIRKGAAKDKDWEVYSEDTRRYWRIIRVGNHTEAYQIFADMLKKFDRDDLVKLWDLVKERFSTTEPTDDKEKELWVELKRLFEPDSDDTLWKLQRYMHDPLVWRLYDTCGVHHVSSVRGHDIFMLVEKDYPLSKGVQMLMLANKLLVEQHSEMANELLRKIFIQANRPRQ
ncbi:putative reverse transcriptase domain-containing protein [Tanacetum coccineum]